MPAFKYILRDALIVVLLMVGLIGLLGFVSGCKAVGVTGLEGVGVTIETPIGTLAGKIATPTTKPTLATPGGGVVKSP